ncbi:MAG: DUF177 domain-containing protein [Bacteroidota bacterium]
MKSLKEFKIPYVGLKNGLHSFLYSIDKTFFTYFENSLVSEGNLKVEALFDKRDAGFFTLDISVSGAVQVECDRCSDSFFLPISGQNKIIIKFEHDDSLVEEEADVLYINRTDTIIDISHLIYEYIVLAIPIHKVHPTDENGGNTCNQEVLKILEKQEDKINDTPDERWAILEKLKKQK